MANSCPRCSALYVPDADHCPGCGGALETLPPNQVPPSRPTMAEELLNRLRAATIGEFEVLEEIGRGGMARVYLAHEVVLDRRVALKALSPLFTEYPEIVRRFQHEARTAGQLSHPNIVPVFAVYQRDGLSFFSMPHIAGISLRTLLRQAGPLEIDEAVGYILQAAAGLAYAHEQGVVHRDVKPENMLLEEPHGRVALTDFGLAKALGGESLTLPGDMIGTPHYMSPEQCEGRSEVDGRSDQYALALVAYELLAGAHPFGDVDFRQLMMKQLNEDPAPLEEHRPDVPPKISRAIHKALSKDIGDRFPSIYSFAGSLTGAEVKFGPTPPKARAKPREATEGENVDTVWMRDHLRRSHKRRQSRINLIRFAADVARLGRLRRNKITLAAAAAVLIAIAAATISRGGASDAPTIPPGAASSASREAGGTAVDRSESADRTASQDPRLAIPPAAGRDSGAASGQVSEPVMAASRAASGGNGPAARRGEPPGGGEVRGARVETERSARALESLLERYRVALEDESFEALRAHVYKGEIPESDVKTLQMIFNNADELKVELELPELEIEGEVATFTIEHHMRFLQARTKREQTHRIKLSMTFESGANGWRLVQLKN